MHDHYPVDKGTGHQRLWWVFATSATYMIAEFMGGWWTGSLALLADAGHMAIDVASIALGLLALWIARRPANDSKTFGYLRAEILGALINGAMLVAMAIWIAVEAFGRYRNPPEFNSVPMTFIAAGGLLLNLVSLFILHEHRHDGVNARGVWWHLVGDTLGSLSAVAAGILSWKLHWNSADPILSIFISALILIGAWRLLSDCVNVLLEGTPRGIKVEELRRAMQSVSDVVEIHDLHVWTVMSGLNALSAHVKIHREGAQAKILKELTELLAHRFHIDHVTLQLEPPAYSHEEVDCSLRS